MNRYLSRTTRSFILFIIINAAIFYYLNYSSDSEYWIEVFGETRIKLFLIPHIPFLLGIATNILQYKILTKYLLITGIILTGVSIAIPPLILGLSILAGPT